MASAGYSIFGGTGLVNQSFGTGPTWTYHPATQMIEVTTPNGVQSFGVGDVTTGNSTDVFSAERVDPITGDKHTLSMNRFRVDGVAMTYTRFGGYSLVDASSVAQGTFSSVFGIPTESGDMPTIGAATYSTSYFATVADSSNAGVTEWYVVSDASGFATFSINFETGGIGTDIHLLGRNLQAIDQTKDFGVISGLGQLSGNGPGFDGQFVGPADGVFNGAFFGPGAIEMGYLFTALGPDFNVSGRVAGRKD